MPKRLLPLLFTFFIFSSFINIVQASTKNILVLHSYHQGLEWTDNVTQGIQSVLTSQQHEIYYQYLDTKRNTGEQYEKNLIEFFQSKKQHINFDLVIVFDNNALEFIQQYGEELYPNAPIIFGGINDFNETLITGIKQVTGIVETIDTLGTIELMLSVHPNSKEIIIINDQTTTGKAIAQQVKKSTQHLKDRVNFQFYDNFSFDNIKQDLTDIKEDSLIYLLTFNRDKNNHFISYRDGINLINNIIKVPIYGSWDFYLGKGIVGGVISSGFFQGKQVAQIALKVLAGEKANDIPIIKEITNQTIFDYNLMTKFNISKKQLPVGSKVINSPPAFLERLQFIPRWLIFTITGAMLLLLMQIVNQRRNKLTIEQMNKSLDIQVKNKTVALYEASEKLNILLDTLPCPIFYKNADCIYQVCNDAFAKTILGLPKEKINNHSLYDLSNRIPADLAKVYNQQDLELMKNPGVQLYEAQVKCFDDITRDYMLYKATLTDTTGKVTGVVGAMLDISDRKKSEIYLKESEERFFSLQEASFEGIAIHNGGVLIDVNQRLSEMTGYAIDELIGMDGFDLFSPNIKTAF
ncbi:ABC transporter substrate binding protein [Psychromonas sp. KJ10-10]|uniref:ABC transporter substrate binding protein n=1 Tax=Psychromonas sp. KJ10-10 TaxID=3391823 RepID=UPI0039B59123